MPLLLAAPLGAPPGAAGRPEVAYQPYGEMQMAIGGVDTHWKQEAFPPFPPLPPLPPLWPAAFTQTDVPPAPP